MSDAKSKAHHIWHVWLNHRNKPGSGGQFDHSMYDFKSMLDFLQGGPGQIERAFESDLAVMHQQCSMSSPEPITNNVLKCAFGTDVTKCEILASLRETFNDLRQREARGLIGRYYADVPDGEMYRIMANTCAWHMYTEPLKTGQFLDTSEGWLQDESDRRFWNRVYDSLGGGQ